MSSWQNIAWKGEHSGPHLYGYIRMPCCFIVRDTSAPEFGNVDAIEKSHDLVYDRLWETWFLMLVQSACASRTRHYCYCLLA